MAAQDLSAILDDIIASFNQGDLDRLRGLVDPDVVYQETGTGRRVQGVDAYVDLLAAWRRGLPDVNGTSTARLTGPDRAAIEVTWTATHTGPLATPDGDIPPTGKPFEIDASIWCAFEGDTVVEIHNHLDVLSMLKQLGLA